MATTLSSTKSILGPGCMQYYATGSGAIDHRIPVGMPFQHLETEITFDSAPALSGDLTIKKYDGIGSAYDKALHTEDPSSTSVTAIIAQFRGERLYTEEDSIGVEYSNPSSRTWTLIIKVRK